MKTGKVLSVNVSPKRGTEKQNVKEANIIEGWGLEGDGHGGDWDRQVSVFPVEALAKVPSDKMDEVVNGGMTENITIEGLPLEELAVGKMLAVGEALVQILYIGKEISKEHGRPYIVSREGRFCKVVKGGRVKVGDEVKIVG
jgi:MOSC domain-containing protein YiiM